MPNLKHRIFHSTKDINSYTQTKSKFQHSDVKIHPWSSNHGDPRISKWKASKVDPHLIAFYPHNFPFFVYPQNLHQDTIMLLPMEEVQENNHHYSTSPSSHHRWCNINLRIKIKNLLCEFIFLNYFISSHIHHLMWCHVIPTYFISKCHKMQGIMTRRIISPMGSHFQPY